MPGLFRLSIPMTAGGLGWTTPYLFLGKDGLTLFDCGYGTRGAIAALPAARGCGCGQALATALITMMFGMVLEGLPAAVVLIPVVFPIAEKMGIEWVEFSVERSVATMPVEGNTQPVGLLHGGAYIQGNRAYLPYSAGGFVILDITDITQPQLISDLPFSPPFQAFIAVHTAVPLVNKPLVIVNSEAIAEQGDEALGYAGIVDISDERKPRLISLFPQPIPDPAMGIKNFYELPGRFGPHNQHQPQFQKVLWQNEDLVFLTYFNAGLRVYDISDPRTPKEIAYFIPPAPTQRLGPLPQTGLVTQTEDVLVDARGNIFISDKNRGVCVLRLQS